MTLLENWRNLAYGEGTNDKEKEILWKNYFGVEKGIYEKIYFNAQCFATLHWNSYGTKNQL